MRHRSAGSPAAATDHRHQGTSPMDQGQQILCDAHLNRGTAFTTEQRHALGLTGRLPASIESLDEQAARSYEQLAEQPDDLAKYVYLNALHDRNEIVYFRLLTDHLAELLPVVYDPTIGDAIEQWSQEYRRSRALYLSIDHIDDVRASFQTLGLGPDDVDLIVCSDAEEILGIGDWGVNGTDIAVGKLAIYTAAAGIDPARVIAVNLDVGTDNRALLDDPAYLGNRHERVRGTKYDELIETYLEVASELFPNAVLHFEDFGPSNARRILTEHGEKYRIFNDDMQGTGAIVMAAVMSGMKVTGQNFADQRLVVFGAGTAGTGMADQISAAMVADGLTPEQARSRVWLIDINGLITDDMTALPDYQQPYARPAGEMSGGGKGMDLLSVVEAVRPTILIGTSTVAGAFTEEVVRALCAGVKRPILLPLSNPTSRIEVSPRDAVVWSDGAALVATGIPADPVEHGGVTYQIGQGNNALLYPGLGLGIIVSGASRVTDAMLLAAANAVAGQVDVSAAGASLLPPVEDLRASSAIVAAAVARAAAEEGVATNIHHDVDAAVHEAMWIPEYGPFDVANYREAAR
ncbi:MULTISPECIES: NAD-dependent malic enzyme [unclassified Rhodococcus (in: high G+C Gram-positive bacteria)]|uniref:NAD-dependent malic enzyme n=1 Tax=unclassified Rhodococcus (in: high G+C Gram-positive bacteria) TaxID=192944 RepID=UPI0020CE336F|nr:MULTISPECIES: NAD-dependent malic enzyme [unclassified Rhodococcus (in: high G+C Gram-positive bacteria)]